jgi:hypothetical protein
LRSPFLPSTVALVAAVSRSARIGTITAETVQASGAGDAGGPAEGPSHEARARQMSAASAGRGLFRGVWPTVAFTFMEV